MQKLPNVGGQFVAPLNAEFFKRVAQVITHGGKANVELACNVLV
jgi:hypothetical protein